MNYFLHLDMRCRYPFDHAMGLVKRRNERLAAHKKNMADDATTASHARRGSKRLPEPPMKPGATTPMALPGSMARRRPSAMAESLGPSMGSLASPHTPRTNPARLDLSGIELIVRRGALQCVPPSV